MGGIVGVVAAFVGWAVLKIFVGLIFWNAELGTTVGNVFAYVAVPAGIVIGFLIPIWEQSKLAEKEEAAEAQRQARANSHYQQTILDIEQRRKRSEAEQVAKLNLERRSLKELRRAIFKKYNGLSPSLVAAGQWLDAAEKEFEERAFAPFWDSLESATNSLGEYYEALSQINSYLSDFRERRSRLPLPTPGLNIDPNGLPDGRPIASRLISICRLGQKDFQFASIYEQRKTNQLLFSGFGTLASGLRKIERVVDDAVNDISLQLKTSFNEMKEISEDQRNTLKDILDVSRYQSDTLTGILIASDQQSESLSLLREDVADNHRTSTKEAEKQTKMLDNIQRDKQPPEGLIDRILHHRPDGDTRKAHDVAADDSAEL